MTDIDFQECSICFEQLLSDVVCCKKCEHWIHIKCWRTGTCPFCRSVKGWRKLSRVENSFRNKLTFKCEGCDVKLNVNEMSEHVKTCPEVDVLCECEKLIKRKALQIHLKVCKMVHMKINCDFCNGAMPKHQLQNHLEVCSKVKINCKLCQGLILRNQLDRHLQVCSKKKFECNFCHDHIRGHQLYKHLEVCSENRFLCVGCRLCDRYIPAVKLGDHMTICPKVEFKCELCSAKMLRENQNNHRKICPKTQIKCDSCSAIMVRENQNNHLQVCPKRFSKKRKDP